MSRSSFERREGEGEKSAVRGRLTARGPLTLMAALALACLVALALGLSAQAAGVRSQLPALSHTGYGDGCGAAVDSAGDLYAADDGTVHVYDPAGTELTSFTSEEACQLAAAPGGDLYVQTWTATPGTGGTVQRYVPSQYPPVSGTTYSLDTSLNGTGTLEPGPSRSVAVDPSTGDVYVSHQKIGEAQTVTFSGFSGTFTIGNLPAQCASSETAPIAYAQTEEGTEAIREAMREACETSFINASGEPPSTKVTFTRELAGIDFATLSCDPQAGSAGSCSFAETVKGAPSAISERHPDGSLVTGTIGNGLAGAEYSGLAVDATSGRVLSFDAAHGQVAVFNPGAATPVSTFDGSGTPEGSIGAGIAGTALAIDQASGHVFVYDGSHNVVPEFKADGTYVTQVSDSFVDGSPSGLAVDDSGGANDGVLYVVSAHAVDAFGGLERAQLPALSHTGYGDGCGAAVDSAGDLYAADDGTVHVYDPAGTELTSFTSEEACQLAAAPGGDLYVQTWTATPGTGGTVQRYVPSQYPPVSGTTYSLDTSLNGTGTLEPGPSRSVAVDPSTGDVYVSHQKIGEAQTVTFSGFSGTFTIGNLPAQCASSETAPIAYAQTEEGTEAIREAMREACETSFINASGEPPSTKVTFTRELAGIDFATLSCDPQAGSAGSCSFAETVKGAPSAISERHPDGSLVTGTIGNGLAGAEYSGLAVDATSGRVLSFDAAHGQVAVFNPGAATPVSTFDGSGTPEGSIGAGIAGTALAIDQASGHVFVYDGSHNVVPEFKADGTYVTQVSDSFVDGSPSGLAVDDSGGANDGVLYVVSAHAVDAFGGLTTEDQPTLSVIKSGSGEGTVVSAPAGIDCGTTCDAAFDPGTEVALTATPEAGSSFSGWSGCGSVEGPEGEICKVTVNANSAVTATFVKRILTVSKRGTGAGNVTSQPAGIDCGSTCAAAFAAGGDVILTPGPAAGSKFAGWAGCDSVDVTNRCTVTMNADREVNARFVAQPVIGGQGAGEVTQSSAHLSASVNPEESRTTYQFEYISAAAWLANGERFTGAQSASKAPAAPVAIDAGTTARRVTIAVEGLASSTTYHFRAVATNEAGTVLGERNGAGEEIAHTFTTYPVQQVETNCPNQAFRLGASASLPDCRAYEQATPVDKNGASIAGKVPLTRASIDGNGISFENSAGIGGGTGSQEFPTYVAKRDAESWSTTGLLPSEATGQSAQWLGWSPDFNVAYDEVIKFGQGAAFIAKTLSTGHEQTIVPYTSPSPVYGYVDGSNDGSTVVFEASSRESNPNPDLALTSNAAPGMPNVYSWRQDDPERVELAGVLPDGSVPPAGTSAEANGNVEAQGNKSVNEYTVDDHRVAADGSVFFTDLETGQLYLRLNPTAPETSQRDSKGNCVPDPNFACTIPISASQRTEGKGVGGRDAAGTQPATFMGAAADGSSAFFLSSEKLTNDATTGPEPDLPAIARAGKADPGDKDLKFLPANAHAIATDEVEGYVYWTDPVHSRIGRAKLSGGVAPEPDYLPIPEVEDKPGVLSPARPLGLAVIDQGASKYIFWTEQGELDNEGRPKVEAGRIGRADLDGSNINQACVKGISNPRSVAADTHYIYWTMPKISNPNLGTTGRTELSCAGSVNTNFIEFTEKNGPVEGSPELGGDIAVDAHHIYVSTSPNGFGTSFIMQFELDGSGPPFHGNFPIAVEGTSGAPSLAVDSAHLYWTNVGASEIARSDLDGSGQDDHFITEASHPEALALDSDNVYWAAGQKPGSNAGTDLYRYDKGDGKLHDLVVDESDPNGIEVQGVAGISQDGSFVYFVANGVPGGVGNSPNGEGESAQRGDCKGSNELVDGYCNLYLYHDGSVDFIARLHQGKLFNFGTSEQSTNEDGSGDAHDWIRGRSEVSSVQDDKTARVSADGRVLVFRSQLKLTKYDNEGVECGRDQFGERITGHCTEFYRFTYDNKGLTCITCDPRGEAPSGPARMGSLRPVSFGAIPGTAVLARNLSSNGNRFFFETPDALVGQDVNGEDGCPPWGAGPQRGSSLACQDVYEWEAPETGSCEEGAPSFSSTSGGCAYLISRGKSDSASFFADADPEGENVFIFTYDRLVGQDEDSLMDVYDARVDGGLAEQNQAKAPPPCPGEGCKPPPAPAAAVQTAGTSGYSGPGNPPVKHRHKKKRHHGKKKHGRHHKHSRRASGHNGGAGR